MQALDSVPLWALLVIVLIMALVSTECGFRIGKLRQNEKEPQAQLGTIVASILGLLAFMLAFTFNVALTRFDERREAVLTDANAIGTTYLRADFFAAPEKDQIKKLLREYVQIRSQNLQLKSATFSQAVARSEALQDQLWALAAALGRQHQTPITALFISSLNDVIDMHSKRLTLALHVRVPTSVWVVLFAISSLSLASVGYFCGLAGSRSWPEVIILIACFTIVFILVADLDRPQEGMIQTNQQPMIDLYKKLGPP